MMKHLKNVLLALLFVAIGFAVFGGSLKLGEKLFSLYKGPAKPSPQEMVAQNRRDQPDAATKPGTDKMAEGGLKSDLQTPVPARAVEPVPDGTGKRDSPIGVAQKTVPPAPNEPVPEAQKGVSERASEPKRGVEAVKPAAVASSAVPSAPKEPVPGTQKGVSERASEPKSGMPVVKPSSVAPSAVPSPPKEPLPEAAKGVSERAPGPKKGAQAVKPSAAIPPAVNPSAATPLPTTKPSAVAPSLPTAAAERKPAPKKKEAAAPPPKSKKSQREYKVIVGSFSVKANADDLMDQLKAYHFEPAIVRAETPKGQLYRVVAGSYPSLRVTKIKMDELKELGFSSFFILE